MLSQPVNLASLISKDASKRKRLNRNAKLKQCKLDVRREQWLSQVRSPSCNYQHEVEIAETQERKTGDGALRSNPSTPCLHAQASSALKILRVSAEECDHTPPATVSGSTDESLIDDGPDLEDEDMSDKCSYQETEGECSGGGVYKYQADSIQMNTDEEKDDDLIVEDDWEAAADALGLTVTSSSYQDSTEEAQPVNLETEIAPPPVQRLQQPLSAPDHKLDDVLKPEDEVSSVGNRTKSTGSGAWRTNDAFPRLWKPHASHLESFVSVWAAVQRKSRWEPPTAPLECPICTEELDSTDNSFNSCSCNFRLCLFCHHKIAAEDGRCPGCRKAYSADASARSAHSAAAAYC